MSDSSEGKKKDDVLSLDTLESYLGLCSAAGQWEAALNALVDAAGVDDRIPRFRSVVSHCSWSAVHCLITAERYQQAGEIAARCRLDLSRLPPHALEQWASTVVSRARNAAAESSSGGGDVDGREELRQLATLIGRSTTVTEVIKAVSSALQELANAQEGLLDAGTCAVLKKMGECDREATFQMGRYAANRALAKILGTDPKELARKGPPRGQEGNTTTGSGGEDNHQKNDDEECGRASSSSPPVVEAVGSSRWDRALNLWSQLHPHDQDVVGLNTVLCCLKADGRISEMERLIHLAVGQKTVTRLTENTAHILSSAAVNHNRKDVLNRAIWQLRHHFPSKELDSPRVLVPVLSSLCARGHWRQALKLSKHCVAQTANRKVVKVLSMGVARHCWRTSLSLLSDHSPGFIRCLPVAVACLRVAGEWKTSVRLIERFPSRCGFPPRLGEVDRTVRSCSNVGDDLENYINPNKSQLPISPPTLMSEEAMARELLECCEQLSKSKYDVPRAVKVAVRRFVDNF